MTIRFLAGLTKFANMPSNITKKLMETYDTKLTYFHFLFEAKDISVTAGTLGSDEIVVRPHYSWTPLDYYVTSHAISHCNCPWKLNFGHSSIDNDMFELFYQGCATPGGTRYRGLISHAFFRENDITSKSMPTHILQDMRVLHLSHNKLDGSACDLLAKVVSSMFRLEDLWFGKNLIKNGGAGTVAIQNSDWGITL